MSACDSGQTFHYRNDTDEVLFVQVNRQGRDRLPPGTVRNIGYFSSRLGDAEDPLTFTIADAGGCIVFELATTLSQFEEDDDSTIRLTESDLPAPEERTECNPDLAD